MSASDAGAVEPATAVPPVPGAATPAAATLHPTPARATVPVEREMEVHGLVGCLAEDLGQ
jgi:hypothetical protein